jgi:hypothetical protein
MNHLAGRPRRAFDTFGIAAIGLGWTFGRHFSESGAA